MKFKIDENSPFSVKKLLKTMGNHKVDSVYHEGKIGIEDKDLLQLCLREERILITLDNNFSNDILHPRGTFYGIILLKPETQGKKAFLDLFEEFLNKFKLEDVVNKVVIVETHQIMVRWDCI
jgi:predicted nuclease of predicted toxin-antitoxin system